MKTNFRKAANILLVALSVLLISVALNGCHGDNGSNDAFTVSGTVSGLAGAGLVLQNNGVDDLAISANGPFTFATSVANGAAYVVTVKTQPSGPSQTCTANSNTGTIAGANVSNVTVVCSTDAFTVGGTVSGLAGTGLELQNNGGNDLAILANGPFTFSTPVANGAAYVVTVKTQPSGPSQICTAHSNTGMIAGANVSNVTVTCTTIPPAGYSELLFVSDGTTLITSSVSGSASAELSSAAISGITGTYDRAGTLVTVTIPNHDLLNNFWVDLVFSSGTGGTATSGQYQVTYVDANTFTINDSASGTITNGAMVRKPTTTLAATYSQLATVVTVTFTNHNLSSGDTVQLHFTSGTAVDLTKNIASIIGPDSFTVTADNSDTTSGNVQVIIGGNYTIFGIAMHPSGNWVYTTSTYECWSGSPFCWGGGLISRFAVNWSTGALTFEKAEHSGVTNRATPVTLNFSPDGTRLFNQDDDLDGIVMWSVNPTTGDLTLLDSVPGTSLHGVGVSADGTRVYNGDTVFSALTSSITVTYTNIGGANSNVIVGTTMFCADADIVSAYSITNPDAPSLIASAPTYTQEVREVAVSNNGARIVSAGWNGLLSFDYNGAAITPAAAAGSNEYVDGGVWLTSGTRKMFRSVSINDAGNMIATSYFTNKSGTQGGIPPSGYMLINLAADGSLSLANDYANNYYSRVATFFKKP